MPLYASIFPLVSTRALARPFTYRAEGLVKGSIVAIPFGRAQRRGVVVELHDEPPPEGVESLEVERVVGAVSPALVDLALWLAEYYGSTPARALALVAPVSRRRRGVPALPSAPDAVLAEAHPPKQLSEPQERALERIVGAFGSGKSLLLFGETGSGKTEIYLLACAEALARGAGAIVLVPEIALTPQAVARFRMRFGDRVAVLHSALTDAERRDERERIIQGAARIVVGARSAIFAPVAGLALIVVDEEHDSSYKQESDPRYDARAVAAKRAVLEGALALFGSATPRPESFARLERLDLGARLVGTLSPLRIVDLRHEQGYPLSAPLLRELARLADGEGKAILLLNRRGVAPALHCRACGRTARCGSCDVALALHGDGLLHCHHCGARIPSFRLCPACGSAEVARIGAGTERLETELAARFPALERFRLDADAVGRRGGVEEILSGFARARRAVLLGTQMVAKGHHFGDVTLAAVVDADIALAHPDFRSEERLFQLVTQLAGRSGRDVPGRVLVQTFVPDARPIVLAARHAVEEFLAGELERRRELGYPPFRHLIRVLASAPEPSPPVRALAELREALAAAVPDAALLGPASLLRLRGRHRAQLLVKAEAPRRVASLAARWLAAAAPAMRREGLTAVVDVDPQQLG